MTLLIVETLSIGIIDLDKENTRWLSHEQVDNRHNGAQRMETFGSFKTDMLVCCLLG